MRCNLSKFTAIQIIKLIVLAMSIAYSIYLLIVAYASFYSPSVKAPYTELYVILLGTLSLFISIRPIKIAHHHNHHQHNDRNVQQYAPDQKLYSKLVWGIYLIVIGTITTISLMFRDIYITCVLWIVAGILHIVQFCKFHLSQQHEAKSILTEEENIEEDMNNFNIGRQLQISNKSCENKLKSCCLVGLCVFMTWFTLISMLIATYFINYPLIGFTYNIAYPSNSTNKNIKIHAYCSTTSVPNKYPTLFLEHGGGANLISFLPLFSVLATNYNIQGCAYDRLGYGRSDKIIPNLTPKEKAEITHQLIQQLKDKNVVSQELIFGGWSAGVQLSMNYLNEYPSNISGMIFMDGYPDYLVLQSIVNNNSQVEPDSASFLGQFLRVVEPFGVDLFFGSNNIKNQTLNKYYDGYYKTGYLWDSQTTDMKAPSITSWLTEVANIKQDSKPIYGNSTSKIDLNWPNIQIPLLLLPASQTVYTDQVENMYMLQMKKYLEKCTNALKEIYVIKGDHAFPTVAIEEVASKIQKFMQKVIEND